MINPVFCIQGLGVFMNLNFEEIVRFVKEHLLSLMIVLLVMGSFIGGLSYKLIEEYKELNGAKEKFNQEMLTKNAELDQKELNILKREQELGIKEKNFSQQRQDIENKLNSYKTEIDLKSQYYQLDLAQLKIQENALSEEVTLRQREQQIENLISQFTRLGVDRSINPNCLSPEEKKAYNQANNLYNEILTIANKNNMKDKYSDFFIKNSSGILVFRSGC